VDEAIVQSIGSIDTPASPAGEAYNDFSRSLGGVTYSIRKKFREGLLATKVDDLIYVAERYLGKDSSVAAITSDDILARESEGYPFSKNKI